MSQAAVPRLDVRSSGGVEGHVREVGAIGKGTVYCIKVALLPRGASQQCGAVVAFDFA